MRYPSPLALGTRVPLTPGLNPSPTGLCDGPRSPLHDGQVHRAAARARGNGETRPHTPPTHPPLHTSPYTCLLYTSPSPRDAHES
eukprot:5492839-Prymnesium_polylepis.1